MEDYDKIMKYGTEEEKEKIKSKIPLGIFQDINKSGFFEEYEKLVNRLQEKKSKTAKTKGRK
jgi:hypothetical protein